MDLPLALDCETPGDGRRVGSTITQLSGKVLPIRQPCGSDPKGGYIGCCIQQATRHSGCMTVDNNQYTLCVKESKEGGAANSVDSGFEKLLNRTRVGSVNPDPFTTTTNHGHMKVVVCLKRRKTIPKKDRSNMPTILI